MMKNVYWSSCKIPVAFVCGGAVVWGAELQAGKVSGSIPDGVIGIF